jgi:exodeoxyribonuclease VII large subunit
MDNKVYTLEALLTELKGVIKDSFPDARWVTAEIAEVKENQKGHCYLQLVERKEEGIVAKVQANIWAYRYRELFQKFFTSTGEPLKVGMKVMLLVTVDFHEQYGLSLNIKDVEPSYTIGELALKRREIIERLKRGGLLDKNKALMLPIAPQRIAVISSKQAAGYGDFIDQLTNNVNGYRFKVRLFQSLMQGDGAEASILEALGAILSSVSEFDLVVIIRGGGAALDLSCFDSYELAAAVAAFPLPVITGIGHEKDDTILDMVAHTRLKTPTAVAEFLISGLRAFEDRLLEIYQRLEAKTRGYLWNEQQRLERVSSRFIYSAKNFVSASRNRLDLLYERLYRSSGHFLEAHSLRLDKLEQALRLLSPENVLKRGYSITTHKGKAIKDISILRDGDEILTQLKDFQFKSIYKAETKKGGKGVAKTVGPNLFAGID